MAQHSTAPVYLRGVRTDSQAWFAGSATKATVAAVPMIEGPIQGPALLCAVALVHSDQNKHMSVMGSLC